MRHIVHFPISYLCTFNIPLATVAAWWRRWQCWPVQRSVWLPFDPRPPPEWPPGAIPLWRYTASVSTSAAGAAPGRRPSVPARPPPRRYPAPSCRAAEVSWSGCVACAVVTLPGDRATAHASTVAGVGADFLSRVLAVTRTPGRLRLPVRSWRRVAASAPAATAAPTPPPRPRWSRCWRRSIVPVATRAPRPTAAPGPTVVGATRPSGETLYPCPPRRPWPAGALWPWAAYRATRGNRVRSPPSGPLFSNATATGGWPPTSCSRRAVWAGRPVRSPPTAGLSPGPWGSSVGSWSRRRRPRRPGRRPPPRRRAAGAHNPLWWPAWRPCEVHQTPWSFYPYWSSSHLKARPPTPPPRPPGSTHPPGCAAYCLLQAAAASPVHCHMLRHQQWWYSTVPPPVPVLPCPVARREATGTTAFNLSAPHTQEVLHRSPVAHTQTVSARGVV